MFEGLLERAAHVEEATTEAELWSRFRDAIRRFGFQWSIYITCADLDEPAGSGAIAGRQRLYLETDLPGHEKRTVGPNDVFEPFLDHCCQSYAITATGVEFADDYSYLDEDSRRFIEAAGRRGFRSGLGIPMRLQSSTRYGGFNLGTSLDRSTFEDRIWPGRELVRAFCLIVHRRAEVLLNEGHPGAARDMPQVLSPRERQCIVLLAGGLRVQAIADALGVGESAVALYLRNARTKLGARTREQLVALALTGGVRT